MLRIAVVEDDHDSRERLTQYLEQYQQERGVRLQISCFQDGDAIVDGYQSVYDLILMDIQMPLLDGMTAAELIRSMDDEVILIFLTNMKQYAIQGYRVGALDYLLKPVSYFALSQRLDKALQQLRRRRKQYVTFVSQGNWYKLELSQIYYIECQNHTLYYHTHSGNFPVNGTMKNLEREMEPYGCFFRCGKGYLVNLEHIDAVQDSCAVVAGQLLPISRGKKSALLGALSRYLNGGIS